MAAAPGHRRLPRALPEGDRPSAVKPYFVAHRRLPRALQGRARAEAPQDEGHVRAAAPARASKADISIDGAYCHPERDLHIALSEAPAVGI